MIKKEKRRKEEIVKFDGTNNILDHKNPAEKIIIEAYVRILLMKINSLMKNNFLKYPFSYCGVLIKKSYFESLVLNVFYRPGLHIYFLFRIPYQRSFQSGSPLEDLENIFVLCSYTNNATI